MQSPPNLRHITLRNYASTPDEAILIMEDCNDGALLRSGPHSDGLLFPLGRFNR